MRVTMRSAPREVWGGIDYGNPAAGKWGKVYEVLVEFNSERAAIEFVDEMRRRHGVLIGSYRDSEEKAEPQS